MLPLLLDDGRDGKNGSLVAAVQYGELMLEMPEYNALNRDGSGRNGICPKQARNGAEYKPANAAEPVATATWLSAALQLSTKNGSVPLLVCTELRELTDHVPCGESSHDNLAGIDANGAMLPSMVDLDDAIAQVFPYRLRKQFHEA